MFKKKIVSTIFKYNLIENNDKILIGLSGGADSVCLFHILYELGEEFNLTLECAHINHGIRGEEADNDAEFVKKLCGMHNIKIHILKKDVKKYAEINGLSVEEAGRIVRYSYFDELAGDDFKIATAHTKDDNAENVLINLLRGNKPLGINPLRDNIIRPLIEVEKSEIIAYLAEREYRTDSTNFSDIYLRNKVRLQLIPFIKEKFNRNFTNTVYNISNVLFCENEYFSEIVDEFLGIHLVKDEKRLILSVKEVKKLHRAVKRRLVKELYLAVNKGKSDLSYKNINDVLNLIENEKTGKKIVLPKDIIAEISYENLIFRENKKEKAYFYELSLNNTVEISEIDKKFILSDREMDISYKYLYKIYADRLIIRSKEAGDRVKIKNGHKNLSDMFTDKKIPHYIREVTPMILANDEIIIVPDIYISENVNKGHLYLYIGEIQ